MSEGPRVYLIPSYGVSPTALRTLSSAPCEMRKSASGENPNDTA